MAFIKCDCLHLKVCEHRGVCEKSLRRVVYETEDTIWGAFTKLFNDGCPYRIAENTAGKKENKESPDNSAVLAEAKEVIDNLLTEWKSGGDISDDAIEDAEQFVAKSLPTGHQQLKAEILPDIERSLEIVGDSNLELSGKLERVKAKLSAV